MNYEEAKKYANEWTTSPEFARWFLKLDAIVNCERCGGDGRLDGLGDRSIPCPTCSPLRASLKTKNGGQP